jgi:integrase
MKAVGVKTRDSGKLELNEKTLKAISSGKLDFAGRIFGGRGLFAEVSPRGTVSFAIKFRRDGKERREGLGRWPQVSVDEAYRKAVNFDREASPAASTTTFGEAADEWAKAHEGKLHERTLVQVKRYLNACKDEFGTKKLRRVKPSDVLAVLRKFERRGAVESAKRARIYAHKVFARAMDPDEPFPNPASLEFLKDKVSPPPRAVHHKAMPPAQIPDFLEMLAADNVHPSIRGALRFAVLTALRTGEVLGLRWSDVKPDLSSLTIPAERMKSGREATGAPHTVFLSRQAREVLETIKPFSKGRDHVFPGRDPRGPLSNMAMLGYLGPKTDGCTVHGFRSSFFDWALSKSGGNAAQHVADLCLAHTIGDKVRAAYLRGTFDDERAELWQKWADHCVPPKKKGAKK